MSLSLSTRVSTNPPSALETSSTTATRAMATPTRSVVPVTPIAQKQLQATPTGTWKHPRFNEITRRQHATTFDERNVRTIVANGFYLLSSFAAFRVVAQVALLRSLSNPLAEFYNSIPYSNLGLWAVRLLFVVNIFQALLPVIRRYAPDDIADIPLTPSQRQSMGLDPNVTTPQTPGSAYQSPNYVTPPRYQKSTPRSSFGTPNEANSPLSSSPRASMAKSTSNSPFSPNTGSPLFQKALGAGSATKRLSYDSRGSPLSGSSMLLESSSSNTPGTPTPSTGKASVGLNNKWLYEKRSYSPRSSLY